MPIFLLPVLVTMAMVAADGPPAVAHITAAEAAAKAAAGTPVLLQSDRYKVLLAERNKGGEAEVHDTDTDVIRVVSGRATLITGGRMIDAKVTAPGETRAPSIDGGDVRVVAEGDVLVVPAGVPHWFKAVEGSVQYFVVKVVK
jgi:quercetin dioxygenase-like cupin family protein